MVKQARTDNNPILELLYFRGRYQLATADALYSDGEKYRPLKIALGRIKSHLKEAGNVLVLGTGLGSAVHIIHKWGYSPDITMVEKDGLVLQWAMEVLPGGYRGNISPVCTDALHFMAVNTGHFDIVIADIFISRTVPPFVTTKEFLQRCHDSVTPGGYFILNYIVQHNDEWLPVDAAIRSVFSKCYCIDDGLNRIVIATV